MRRTLAGRIDKNIVMSNEAMIAMIDKHSRIKKTSLVGFQSDSRLSGPVVSVDSTSPLLTCPPYFLTLRSIWTSASRVMVSAVEEPFSVGEGVHREARIRLENAIKQDTKTSCRNVLRLKCSLFCVDLCWTYPALIGPQEKKFGVNS